MSEVVIYHNPRCSKSRATLELLHEKGVEPRVVEYLKAPPTRAELEQVLAKLGVPAERIVRKGESVYREKYAGRAMSESEWLDALVADPVLIERPIVVRGGKAAIGRPPENVLTVL
jgi:arsenate reductase